MRGDLALSLQPAATVLFYRFHFRLLLKTDNKLEDETRKPKEISKTENTRERYQRPL